MDHESKSTFSKILGLTEEMVSTTIMVTGVRLAVGATFFDLSVFAILISFSEWHTHHLYIRFVDAFLVEYRM